MENSEQHQESIDKIIEIASDPEQLLRYGICKVRIPNLIESNDSSSEQEAYWKKWASDLSQVTPEIMAGEGDGEYVFYRNILEEPGFPFDAILRSEIGEAIVKYFGLESLEEIRLDDAFCIHYNSDLADTSGSKHTDPSDITVNLCLEKSDEVEGSHVLFYGTKALTSVDATRVSIGTDDQAAEDVAADKPDKFMVVQEAGYATIHWGNHLHETTPLKAGKRTNIVLTFWYKDHSRSDAASRTCYS